MQDKAARLRDAIRAIVDGLRSVQEVAQEIEDEEEKPPSPILTLIRGGREEE